jgi:predicted Zn-dependent protease
VERQLYIACYEETCPHFQPRCCNPYPWVRKKSRYTFRLLDAELINAFALPGGYVYFTRGIMAHFNNEAELMGVLGHEVGHIAARHSIVQQRNQLFGQLGLIAGLVLVPDLAPFAESAQQGLGLLFLKFGRDAERQSDELGVEYSSRLGKKQQQLPCKKTN